MDEKEKHGIIDDCFLIWVTIMEQAGKEKKAEPSKEANPPDDKRA